MNYYAKLKELREKVSQKPWNVHFRDQGSQYASAWANDNEELTLDDLELTDTMRNSLDLWLELFEACEWFEESEMGHVPEEHGLLGSWHAIKTALTKLRGEDKSK